MLDFKEILTKEPFYEVIPYGYRARAVFHRGQSPYNMDDTLAMRVKTQADMLREYYPTGHRIMDSIEYPDIYKQDPDTKKWFKQPISRTAFAFQQIISTKRTIHICGNDMQFELSGKAAPTESENNALNDDLLDFRQGWLDMDMERNFYLSARSINITGDAAVVAYFDDGEAKARTLSYLDGDTLYPHINPITGKMEIFARRFYGLDESGKVRSENVEVWDDKFYYRAVRGKSDTGIVNRIKEFFGLAGYKIIEQKHHGFPFCPVAYFRSSDNGPCWSAAQNSIESFEESFSYLREDNKAHAFPIMYYKGDGVDFNGDQITGAVKSIAINDPDGEVGFLNRPETSEAFNAELQKLYDMIYEQAFAVKPPELKSGDLPGVALKLLYSPAIERAICDAQEMQPFVNDLVRIVKAGYGIQINKQVSLMNLKINAWIEPYVHQNDTELFANLATGVQNGFLSKQTASERNTKFSKNDEFERVMMEDLEKRKRETQEAINQQRGILQAQAEEEIKKNKALTELDNGGDVNTGRHLRTTDENGNHPNEDNWDKWNQNRQ